MPFQGDGAYPDQSTVVSHQLVLASLEVPRGMTALLKHVLRAFLQHRPENPEMYAYVFLSTMLRQRDSGKLDDDILDDAKNGLFPRQPAQRVSVATRRDQRQQQEAEQQQQQSNDAKGLKRHVALSTAGGGGGHHHPGSAAAKKMEQGLQREIDDFVQDFHTSLNMEVKPYE